MKVHTVASQPHYHWHLDAVFRHLPEIVKGEQRVGPRVDAYGLDPDDVIMVAGYIDIGKSQGRPVIYVEHGAGQTYNGLEDTPEVFYYSGSKHPPEVIGYISPNKTVADSWSQPAMPVGCPYLDDVKRRKKRKDELPKAFITFHADNPRWIVPEMRSALSHYLPAFAQMRRHLVDAGYAVYGHGHPKDVRAKGRFDHFRIPFVDHPHEVFAEADLLIADNTSLMYEAAHLDIPVLALNAPWYRHDVEHGLRFWTFVPGYEIESPREFVDFDLATVTDPGSQHLRDVSAYRAYGADRPTGKAGPVAAMFVTDLLADLGWRP